MPDETPGVTQCSQHFYAHEESLRQNKEDIAKLTESLSGVPTDIKHILEAVGKLQDTMAGLDAKYVSRENLGLLMETQSDRLKLWVIGGAGTTLATAVMLSYYITHMGGR